MNPLSVPYSLDGYKQLINYLQEKNFTCLPVSATSLTKLSDSSTKRLCLLRHDVDADLEAAVLMAKLENEMKIKSIYFLMTQSPVYNLFSRASSSLVHKILEFGHDIGLHYDQFYFENLGTHRSETVDEQARMISSFYNCQINAYSTHQPSVNILDMKSYSGQLIDCYNDKRLKEFKYLSDSNRGLNIDFLERLTTDDENPSKPNNPNQSIQLLIHPMWWVYEDTSTAKVWDATLRVNFNQIQRQLLQTERSYGSEREIHIKEQKRID